MTRGRHPGVCIEILPASRESFAELSSIPISFEVRSILRVRVVKGGLGGVLLKEEPVARPYVKDYDALDGEGPTRWLRRFNTANWTVMIARQARRAMGGAVLVMASPDIYMLKGRNDLAILWDLRVRPESRGQGIGVALFRRAVQLAKDKGIAQMSVETQNVNVPACKFYRKQGCSLGEIGRFQYISNPSTAHEVMLV